MDDEYDGTYYERDDDDKDKLHNSDDAYDEDVDEYEEFAHPNQLARHVHSGRCIRLSYEVS